MARPRNTDRPPPEDSKCGRMIRLDSWPYAAGCQEPATMWGLAPEEPVCAGHRAQDDYEALLRQMRFEETSSGVGIMRQSSWRIIHMPTSLAVNGEIGESRDNVLNRLLVKLARRQLAESRAEEGK